MQRRKHSREFRQKQGYSVPQSFPHFSGTSGAGDASCSPDLTKDQPISSFSLPSAGPATAQVIDMIVRFGARLGSLAVDDQPIVLRCEMDRKVFGWLNANLGRVLRLTPHARWRTGWDAEVERGGEIVSLYIRGPRGDNYVSPIDMPQEAAIHCAFLAGGIPAPNVKGLIDDPCSLVLERIPGTINTATIDDPAERRQVRKEFVEIIARLHRLPLESFADVGLVIPVGADAVSRGLYAASEAIFDRAGFGQA